MPAYQTVDNLARTDLVRVVKSPGERDSHEGWATLDTIQATPDQVINASIVHVNEGPTWVKLDDEGIKLRSGTRIYNQSDLADGVILLTNEAKNAFDRIIMGDTSNGGALVNVDNAGVQIKLGTSATYGYIDAAALRVSGTKVVGAQGAAVADATDAASTQARLNDLLARLRTHGLIAT